MSKELMLYILLFIVRAVIITYLLFKYGWKVWGLTMLYTLLTEISEIPEAMR